MNWPQWLLFCSYDCTIQEMAVHINANNVNTLTYDGRGVVVYVACNGNADKLRWVLSLGAHIPPPYPTMDVLLKHLKMSRQHTRAVVNYNHLDIQTKIKILIAAGANIEGLDDIPPWVSDYADAMKRCKLAAAVVVGIRRFGRSDVLQTQPRDVVGLIARAVLETKRQWAE